MIAKKIISSLEEKYPKVLAEEWDNVGLLLGDIKKEIKRVQLSIDATQKAIDRAVENEVDMIITHHPFIFKGLKSIDLSSVMGKKIKTLIKNDINIYSLHTNLDSAKGGLNDYILNLLGVEESRVIEKNRADETCGIGRIYKLEKECSLEEYIEFLKQKLELESVRLTTQDESVKIKRIALINGSAMSYWRKVKTLGADLFITGDVGYHEALDAQESGLSVVDIGHFESEQHFSKLLKIHLETLGVEVTIYNDGPVFKNY